MKINPMISGIRTPLRNIIVHRQAYGPLHKDENSIFETYIRLHEELAAQKQLAAKLKYEYEEIEQMQENVKEHISLFWEAAEHFAPAVGFKINTLERFAGKGMQDFEIPEKSLLVMAQLLEKVWLHYYEHLRKYDKDFDRLFFGNLGFSNNYTTYMEKYIPYLESDQSKAMLNLLGLGMDHQGFKEELWMYELEFKDSVELRYCYREAHDILDTNSKKCFECFSLVAKWIRENFAS